LLRDTTLSAGGREQGTVADITGVPALQSAILARSADVSAPGGKLASTIATRQDKLEMPESTGFILGFDPGGIGRFGWSVCSATPGTLVLLQTRLADDAVGALHGVERAMESCDLQGTPPVLAAGIDAPMFWGEKGNREIDATLRRVLRETQFPTPGGTVQQVNSLRGACLAQGMLLGKYLHER